VWQTGKIFAVLSVNKRTVMQQPSQSTQDSESAALFHPVAIVLEAVPVSNMAATEPDLQRKGARREICSLQMEGETQRRTKSGSSLRGALKILTKGVAPLAKGTTLRQTLRLVWRNFEQQRGSCLKRE